ncbi:exodeoxyribonuclease V subunit alpha [Providencia rettgeri]|uniref:exodeoxyribonuclease V subunit alpha n=1 Tax=Providencia rettgeri TaxID=587 RepID=UPI0015EBAEDB|nr:exodeoxyribonuclease V subunit alpha [Providencia rettgeri]QLR06671.1 exodeoxyribonuclease V subunit alpha [Providencia rettgeri]
MKALFNQAIEARIFTPLDVQFAYNVANEDNPILLVVAALLSAETMSGHVCLSLEDIRPDVLFMGRHPEFTAQLWQMIGEPNQAAIRAALLSSESVCEVEGGSVAPLLLSGDFLYFQRMWQYEQCVAHFFSETELADVRNNNIVNDSKIQPILTELFPESTQIDWQKIAAAIALTSRVSVISGGPGTGKTTTVAKILAALIKLGHQQQHRLRIELAAPTGKAAARLTESLGYAMKQLPLNDDERESLPSQAKTLHRLLGAQPESQQFRYHRDNPLALDILIVDEASMVDLPMMGKLIEALPDSAKLIFLGDKDQLASVEAGAVLGDICRFANKGYSPERAAQLERLAGCSLSEFTSNEGPAIRDSLCLLRHSYRFSADSGIGQLAFAVNAGNVKRVDDILTQGFTDIHNYIPNAMPDNENEAEAEISESYANMLLDAVGFYQHYLRAVKARENPADVLHKFNQYRLLAALREGAYGVSGLNDKLEKLLHRQGLITKPYNLQHKHYVGRPVMISRNDSALGLFNGDIGIILLDEERQMRAYFQFPDGSIRGIQPNRLPTHETAYVMTVHKSQGSEFAHTALVLPYVYSPVITRELVYTAMTRAKNELSLYGSKKVLRRAIETPTKRRSGLALQFEHYGLSS